MIQLTKLLDDLEYEVIQMEEDIENISISTLCHDSNKVIKDSLFVCICGVVVDGHSFIDNVARNGACVVIVEKDVVPPKGVTVIRVEKTRYALALLSAAYYGYPTREMLVIGITGTKGKTTTTYMIKGMLEEAGYNVGLIGTIETIIGEKRISSNNTTPDSLVLHYYFREMVKQGIDCVVMEVSSQGLMLDRTAGILFDIAIFTNLQEDHIGPNEHADFDDYLYCKSLLFKQCKRVIGNCDDAYFLKMIKGVLCEVTTIGLNKQSDYSARNLEFMNKCGQLGIAYDLRGLVGFHVEMNIPGKFNVYNSLLAIACCHCLHVTPYNMKKALKQISVKGRVQMMNVSNDFIMLIDYAHNAMSLESILLTLKLYKPSRIVCLFGCGGNRAKSRRVEMGEVSGRLADLTIITSDNPRFEDPQNIIHNIKEGINKTKGEYVEFLDRQEAIKYALEYAQKGDIIVIAGKGHEDYQDVKGIKYQMDDRLIIEEIMNSKA